MISTSINDIRARDGLRNEMADMAEQWKRQRGMSEFPLYPGFQGVVEHDPLTMRQRITADTQQQQAKGWSGMNRTGKKACYDKNAAKFRILPTKPDAEHEITGQHLRQAFRKLGVTGGAVAAAFGRSASWMTRVICHEVGDADFRRQALKKAWELAGVVE